MTMVNIPPAGGTPPSALIRPSGHATTADDQKVLLGHATDADWDLAGVASGRELDRSSHLQPLMLWQIANDRASGALAPGQDVTVSYLSNLKIGTDNSGMLAQLDRAIAFVRAVAADVLADSTSIFDTFA